MTNTCIKVLQLILRTRTKNAKYRCTCSRHWQIYGRGPRKKHKGKMPAEQAKQNYPLPRLPLLSSQSGTATGSKRNKFLKMTTENLSCINDTVI